MALNQLFQGTTGVLQIAGSLSGVPYAGAVATLMTGIVQTANKVQVYRVSRASCCLCIGLTNLQDKCDRLTTKTNLLLSTLQDQSDRLVGTELQEAVDQVKMYVNLPIGNWPSSE